MTKQSEFNTQMASLVSAVNDKSQNPGAKTYNEMVTAINTITPPSGTLNLNITQGTSPTVKDCSEYATVNATVRLQSKALTLSNAQQQLIQPDQGYAGLSSVTIAALTPGIDGNIIASNIRKGVPILGTIGTYEGATGVYTPVQLSPPSFGYTAGGIAPFITKNRDNGQWENAHGLYCEGIYKCNVYQLDNSLATNMSLVSGNYSVTAKNSDNDYFLESNRTSAIYVAIAPLSFSLSHCSVSVPSKRLVTWNDNLTLSADEGYMLPPSITCTTTDGRVYTMNDGVTVSIRQTSSSSHYVTVTYSAASGIIAFGLGDHHPSEIEGLSIKCIAEPAITKHSVTINITASHFEYTMSDVGLSIDGTSYNIWSSVSYWDTDYPYNGVQIQAGRVQTGGYTYRWRDSDHSTWQETTPKTWDIPRDNFVIDIDIAMDA